MHNRFIVYANGRIASIIKSFSRACNLAERVEDLGANNVYISQFSVPTSEQKGE